MSEPDPPTLPAIGVSIVRTAVPAAWGTMLAWLVSIGLPGDLAAAIADVDELLVLLLVTAVYAGARWLESQPWMPAWPAYVLLGSTRQPEYRRTP